MRNSRIAIAALAVALVTVAGALSGGCSRGSASKPSADADRKSFTGPPMPEDAAARMREEQAKAMQRMSRQNVPTTR